MSVKAAFNFRAFLIFIGADIRIFPVFQKTRPVVIADKLDERWRVGFPVLGKTF